MGLLDWMRGRSVRQNDNSQMPEPKVYAANEVAFRFEKPFAHLDHFMTADERKVVDGIEARWRKVYDAFKNAPPMSEGQAYEGAVFDAVDHLCRALVARERGPSKEWDRLEEGVDSAVKNVREAFAEERKFVERERKFFEQEIRPARVKEHSENRAARQKENEHDIPF